MCASKRSDLVLLPVTDGQSQTDGQGSLPQSKTPPGMMLIEHLPLG